MTRILLVIYSILEISGSGGWSTENMRLSAPEPTVNISERGSYAYGVHLGYALQFHPHVGLGIGVDLSRYGSATQISGDRHWTNVTDTEGERYNHRMHIYSLNDKMQQLYVNIPLSLRLIFPLQRVSLEGQIGAKAGMAVKSSADFQGDVAHFGLYPQWGDLEIGQVPNHGFYRTEDIAGTYEWSNSWQVFVFAKFGVLIPLTQTLQLTAHIGADYGLLATEAGIGNDDLGCNNNHDAAHGFMPAYKGIVATNLTNGTMHPLSLTGEIGLRVVLEHRKKYPCKCRLW